MITLTLFNVVDFLLLGAILLFAFEALRVTHFQAQPLCAVAFALITIGAFGWMINNMYGVPVPIYALILHAGVAVHVALLYLKQRSLASTPQRRRSDVHYIATVPRSARSELRDQVKQPFK